jgi:hypothetical protein
LNGINHFKFIFFFSFYNIKNLKINFLKKKKIYSMIKERKKNIFILKYFLVFLGLLNLIFSKENIFKEGLFKGDKNF